MRRPLMALAALLAAASIGLACGPDPCAKLLDKQCEAAGEVWCAAQKEAAAQRESTDEERQRCQAILEDPQKLKDMAEGLKRAMELKAEQKTGKTGQ